MEVQEDDMEVQEEAVLSFAQYVYTYKLQSLLGPYFTEEYSYCNFSEFLELYFWNCTFLELF